jgi:hypothetical protein
MAAVLLLKPTINQYSEEAADGMIEDTWEGRGMWGRCCTIVLGASTPSNERQQKHNTLWPWMATRDYILDTTTNQKHSGMAEEEKNKRRDR